jgi:hypothetical protein
MKVITKNTLLWAFIAAGIVTAFSWLVLGKNSPANHGVPPDVHDSPLIVLLVIPNLPAGIVCVNIFGKHGPDWNYFLCVFVQWLIIAGVVGRIIAWVGKENSN